MEFSFFTIDNKSGYKTKEQWFSKNHNDEYEKITSYCSKYNIPTFKEKIWFYYHGLTELPKCGGCGCDVSFSGRFDRGYQEFCSLKCANTNGDLLERVKKTNLKKHGVEFYTQHEDFIKKQRKTKKERYGDESFSNPSKMKITKKEKYGNSGYNNSNKNKITRRNSFISTIKEKTKDKFISYSLSDDNIKLNCGLCNQNYLIYNNLFNYRTKQNSVLCTICNPMDEKQVSGLELDLINFIGDLVAIKTKDRILLDGKEVDILIPDKKLGVEFNGLYWHSDIYKKKDYHLEKTKLANQKGYNLIHVFEDEWLEKSDIVKSIIKTKLGLVDDRYFGRKCDVRVVDKSYEKAFLNKNHIQGFVGSVVCYGLYHNNELVSLMSFGGLRKSLGYNGEVGCFEMLRFCNKLNSSVVGGASKLLNHFIKEYHPKKIISYSDKRFFDGVTYSNIGFIRDGDTKPNYFYTLKHTKYHRYKFRKSVLVNQGFDSNKTEKQIMGERGYNRIYDCGNIRWVLNV